jgi:hypothetical protein
MIINQRDSVRREAAINNPMRGRRKVLSSGVLKLIRVSSVNIAGTDCTYVCDVCRLIRVPSVCRMTISQTAGEREVVGFRPTASGLNCLNLTGQRDAVQLAIHD